MKKVFSNILIMLVILPGLACGAAACVDAPVDTSASPCHEQASGADENENLSPKIFKDCTGVELAQTSSIDSFKALQFDSVKYVSASWEEFLGKGLYLSDIQPVRAPPTDHPAYQTYPPPYLTTQRLRI